MSNRGDVIGQQPVNKVTNGKTTIQPTTPTAGDYTGFVGEFKRTQEDYEYGTSPLGRFFDKIQDVGNTVSDYLTTQAEETGEIVEGWTGSKTLGDVVQFPSAFLGSLVTGVTNLPGRVVKAGQQLPEIRQDSIEGKRGETLGGLAGVGLTALDAIPFISLATKGVKSAGSALVKTVAKEVVETGAEKAAIKQGAKLAAGQVDDALEAGAKVIATAEDVIPEQQVIGAVTDTNKIPNIGKDIANTKLATTVAEGADDTLKTIIKPDTEVAQITTKVDDIIEGAPKIANKVDDIIEGAPKIATKVDDIVEGAPKIANKVDDIVEGTQKTATKVDDIVDAPKADLTDAGAAKQAAKIKEMEILDDTAGVTKGQAKVAEEASLWAKIAEFGGDLMSIGDPVSQVTRLFLKTIPRNNANKTILRIGDAITSFGAPLIQSQTQNIISNYAEALRNSRDVVQEDYDNFQSKYNLSIEKDDFIAIRSAMTNISQTYNTAKTYEDKVAIYNEYIAYNNSALLPRGINLGIKSLKEFEEQINGIVTHNRTPDKILDALNTRQNTVLKLNPFYNAFNKIAANNEKTRMDGIDRDPFKDKASDPIEMLGFMAERDPNLFRAIYLDAGGTSMVLNVTQPIFSQIARGDELYAELKNIDPENKFLQTRKTEREKYQKSAYLTAKSIANNNFSYEGLEDKIIEDNEDFLTLGVVDERNVIDALKLEIGRKSNGIAGLVPYMLGTLTDKAVNLFAERDSELVVDKYNKGIAANFFRGIHNYAPEIVASLGTSIIYRGLLGATTNIATRRLANAMQSVKMSALGSSMAIIASEAGEEIGFDLGQSVAQGEKYDQGTMTTLLVAGLAGAHAHLNYKQITSKTSAYDFSSDDNVVQEAQSIGLGTLEKGTGLFNRVKDFLLNATAGFNEIYTSDPYTAGQMLEAAAIHQTLQRPAQALKLKTYEIINNAKNATEWSPTLGVTREYFNALQASKLAGTKPPKLMDSHLTDTAKAEFNIMAKTLAEDARIKISRIANFVATVGYDKPQLITNKVKEMEGNLYKMNGVVQQQDQMTLMDIIPPMYEKGGVKVETDFESPASILEAAHSIGNDVLSQAMIFMFGQEKTTVYDKIVGNKMYVPNLDRLLNTKFDSDTFSGIGLQKIDEDIAKYVKAVSTKSMKLNIPMGKGTINLGKIIRDNADVIGKANNSFEIFDENVFPDDMRNRMSQETLESTLRYLNNLVYQYNLSINYYQNPKIQQEGFDGAAEGIMQPSAFEHPDVYVKAMKDILGENFNLSDYRFEYYKDGRDFVGNDYDAVGSFRYPVFKITGNLEIDKKLNTLLNYQRYVNVPTAGAAAKKAEQIAKIKAELKDSDEGWKFVELIDGVDTMNWYSPFLFTINKVFVEGLRNLGDKYSLSLADKFEATFPAVKLGDIYGISVTYAEGKDGKVMLTSDFDEATWDEFIQAMQTIYENPVLFNVIGAYQLGSKEDAIIFKEKVKAQIKSNSVTVDDVRTLPFNNVMGLLYGNDTTTETIDKISKQYYATSSAYDSILTKNNLDKLGVKDIDGYKAATLNSTIIEEIPTTRPVTEALPITEDPLIVEARKYKTAEEFVNGLEEQGKIVYHGTLEEFDDFDISRAGRNTEYPNAKFGIFFTDDIEIAKSFPDLARMPGDKRVGNVKKAYIELNNPIDFTLVGILTKEAQAPTIVELLGWGKMNPKEALKLLNEETDLGNVTEMYDELYGNINNKKILQDNGFDGIISDLGNGKIEQVVFDTKQIKTESQLKQIREQANATRPTTPTTNEPVINTVEANNEYDTINNSIDSINEALKRFKENIVSYNETGKFIYNNNAVLSYIAGAGYENIVGKTKALGGPDSLILWFLFGLDVPRAIDAPNVSAAVGKLIGIYTKHKASKYAGAGNTAEFVTLANALGADIEAVENAIGIIMTLYKYENEFAYDENKIENIVLNFQKKYEGNAKKKTDRMSAIIKKLGTKFSSIRQINEELAALAGDTLQFNQEAEHKVRYIPTQTKALQDKLYWGRKSELMLRKADDVADSGKLYLTYSDYKKHNLYYNGIIVDTFKKGEPRGTPALEGEFFETQDKKGFIYVVPKDVYALNFLGKIDGIVMYDKMKNLLALSLNKKDSEFASLMQSLKGVLEQNTMDKNLLMESIDAFLEMSRPEMEKLTLMKYVDDYFNSDMPAQHINNYNSAKASALIAAVKSAIQNSNTELYTYNIQPETMSDILDRVLLDENFDGMSAKRGLGVYSSAGTAMSVLSRPYGIATDMLNFLFEGENTKPYVESALENADDLPNVFFYGDVEKAVRNIMGDQTKVEMLKEGELAGFGPITKFLDYNIAEYVGSGRGIDFWASSGDLVSSVPSLNLTIETLDVVLREYNTKDFKVVSRNIDNGTTNIIELNANIYKIYNGQEIGTDQNAIDAKKIVAFFDRINENINKLPASVVNILSSFKKNFIENYNKYLEAISQEAAGVLVENPGIPLTKEMVQGIVNTTGVRGGGLALLGVINPKAYTKIFDNMDTFDKVFNNVGKNKITQKQLKKFLTMFGYHNGLLKYTGYTQKVKNALFPMLRGIYGGGAIGPFLMTLGYTLNIIAGTTIGIMWAIPTMIELISKRRLSKTRGIPSYNSDKLEIALNKMGYAYDTKSMFTRDFGDVSSFLERLAGGLPSVMMSFFDAPMAKGALTRYLTNSPDGRARLNRIVESNDAYELANYKAGVEDLYTRAFMGASSNPKMNVLHMGTVWGFVNLNGGFSINQIKHITSSLTGGFFGRRFVEGVRNGMTEYESMRFASSDVEATRAWITMAYSLLRGFRFLSMIEDDEDKVDTGMLWRIMSASSNLRQGFESSPISRAFTDFFEVMLGLDKEEAEYIRTAGVGTFQYATMKGLEQLLSAIKRRFIVLDTASQFAILGSSDPQQALYDAIFSRGDIIASFMDGHVAGQLGQYVPNTRNDALSNILGVQLNEVKEYVNDTRTINRIVGATQSPLSAGLYLVDRLPVIRQILSKAKGYEMYPSTGLLKDALEDVNSLDGYLIMKEGGVPSDMNADEYKYMLQKLAGFSYSKDKNFDTSMRRMSKFSKAEVEFVNNELAAALGVDGYQEFINRLSGIQTTKSYNTDMSRIIYDALAKSEFDVPGSADATLGYMSYTIQQSLARRLGFTGMGDEKLQKDEKNQLLINRTAAEFIGPYIHIANKAAWSEIMTKYISRKMIEKNDAYSAIFEVGEKTEKGWIKDTYIKNPELQNALKWDIVSSLGLQAGDMKASYYNNYLNNIGTIRKFDESLTDFEGNPIEAEKFDQLRDRFKVLAMMDLNIKLESESTLPKMERLAIVSPLIADNFNAITNVLGANMLDEEEENYIKNMILGTYNDLNGVEGGLEELNRIYDQFKNTPYSKSNYNSGVLSNNSYYSSSLSKNNELGTILGDTLEKFAKVMPTNLKDLKVTGKVYDPTLRNTLTQTELGYFIRKSSYASTRAVDVTKGVGRGKLPAIKVRKSSGKKWKPYGGTGNTGA